MAEVGFQFYIHSVYGIKLPYVEYGELLLKLEVLETRAQYPGIIRFDGPLVRKVNDILKKMGGEKGCRLRAPAPGTFPFAETRAPLAGPPRF